MKEELDSVLYYLFTNLRYAWTIFWSILLAFLLVTIAYAFMTKGEYVFFQSSISVYIYCAILGMWMVSHTIPYLIQMSLTRKSIFIGIGIYSILLALIQALLANLFNRVVFLTGKQAMIGDFRLLTGNESYQAQLYHLSQFLPKDHFFTQVAIDFVLCFTAFSFMFFLGLIFYRFGLVVGFSFLIFLFTLYIASIVGGSLVTLIHYIANHYDLILYVQLLGIGMAIYLSAYLLLRRLTIKP